MKFIVLLCLSLSMHLSVYAGNKSSDNSTTHDINHYMPVFIKGQVKFVDSDGILLNDLSLKTKYDICNIITPFDSKLKSVSSEFGFRFHEGKLLIKKRGKYFWNDDVYICYNNEGKELFRVTSDEVGYFSEGLLPVTIATQFLFFTIDTKYGYINNKGDLIISPEYDFAGPFNEGMASVLIDSKYGYIDNEGRKVIKPKFMAESAFSDSLAAVCLDGKFG